MPPRKKKSFLRDPTYSVGTDASPMGRKDNSEKAIATKEKQKYRDLGGAREKKTRMGRK